MVKFFVGDDNCSDYWGDDWNDEPYECNAGRVYDTFIKGYFIKVFDFDDIVMEPSEGYQEKEYSKEDMKQKIVPCICILPKEYRKKYTFYNSFNDIVTNKNAIRYYFGDIVPENETIIKDLNIFE